MIELENIKDSIKREQESYSVQYELDVGYEMCKKYMDTYYNKGKSLLRINIWECLKCMLYVLAKDYEPNNGISIEECEKIIEDIKSVFENNNFAECDVLFKELFSFDDDGFKELDAYLNSSNYSAIRLRAFIVNIIKIASESDEQHELSEEEIKIVGENLNELYELNKKTGKLMDVASFIRKHYKIASDIFDFLLLAKRLESNNMDVMGYFASPEKIHNAKRLRGRVSSIIYRKYCNNTETQNLHDKIGKFVLDEENKKEKITKENNKICRMYNKAIALLDEASKKEVIRNASEIIGCVQSEEIRRKILLWIDEHNEKYYQSLQNRYNELSSSDTNKCLALLSKYRIPINKQDVSVVLHNSLEDIEEIIKSLPLGELSNEHIISILKITTKEIALKIKDFIDRGYITPRKVVEHISIYNPKDKKIEMMESSIELLKLLGINPIIFCDQPEYYWVSKELFEKNITLLGRYRLTNSIKSETNINFLTEEQLEEKIDMIIELGYYEYLKEDIEILNCKESRLKRLIVLQQANIPVEDLETIEDILESPKFVVEDGEIDEYIMDYASYEKEVEIPKIQNNPINIDSESISVSLEGNIISIPKVKRQLEEGKTIWEAIFYGTKLTEERYNQIMRALKPGNVYIYR